MASFEHKQLVESLKHADATPSDVKDYPQWFRGRRHLDLLRHDILHDELILAGFGPAHSCIHSYVVPTDHSVLKDPLKGAKGLSPNPYSSKAAPYAWTWSVNGDNDVLRAAPADDGKLGSSLEGAVPLVFFRDIQGLTSNDPTPIEINQPFVHALGAYWRQSQNAYCRIDHRGDWSEIVSVARPKGGAGTELVTCRREDLELHLVAMGAVLVRSFAFVMSKPTKPIEITYHEHIERAIETQDGFHYIEQFSEGEFGAIRGVQIISPKLSSSEIEQLVKEGRIVAPEESLPVEFVVWDWLNQEISTVSTDTETTRNYFEAASNDLPYETSPAAFRPDVLLKYKADTQKYSVREGWIDCRGAWSLKSYSINDAGQVMVYICDLRHLPHEELLHWKSFNEQPKTGLSERTIQADFMAKWPEEMTSREMLVAVLQRWAGREPEWWKWRPAESPEVRVVVPRTSSRDEWQSALGQLSNDVTEGFSDKALRHILEVHEDDIDKNMRSIALLERILRANGELEGDQKLVALRELNRARNLGPAHAGQSDANEYVNDVLEEHETFAAHFESLCEKLAGELILIEETLADQSED